MNPDSTAPTTTVIAARRINVANTDVTPLLSCRVIGKLTVR
jgi:hypothetical protein